MNLRSRFFAPLFLAFTLLIPIIAQAHGSLLLKSTTSAKTYRATPNSDGKFAFHNVKPGTYTLLIVAPKGYFDSKANETVSDITVQNIQWIPSGYVTAPAANVTTPNVTVTQDMLSNPSFY